MLPVEQYSDEAWYVIRLEVPGIDPAQDLAVSVETGRLTVRCERRHTGPEDGQSEFRYGSFARTIALPPGANINDVSASCRDGVLTVRVGMKPEYQKGARHIPVRVEP